jgi:Vacuolar sorting-associated protein 13, N-terminal
MVKGTDDSAENQSFIASFLEKLLNNIQVTVKNVHIRYEDNISVPDVRLQIPNHKATGRH